MSFDFFSKPWFFLLALVWGIYIAQEMFVSGVGMLSTLYLKDEKQFKYINRSVGTHWDGIQVWLILAVGGMFAAFPNAFGAILTNLYIPIFLLLYIIIVRGMAIELIEKTNNLKLQNALKKAWSISSLLLLVVLGIYSSNIFLGLPIGTNGNLNDNFFSFLVIFNMTSIFCGIMFVLYALALGAIYIKLNADSVISEKINKILKVVPLIASIFLIFIFIGLNAKGGIFNRGIFLDLVWLWALPISSMVLALVGALLAFKEKYLSAFILMCLGMLLFVISGYISLMPNFVFSTIDPNNSLSILKASAGEGTLLVMLISTLIFLPVVIGYQAYKYVKFWRQ